MKAQTKIEVPEGLGKLRIWIFFIFMELGSSCNYFRGAGNHAHTFGELGSIAKKLRKRLLIDLGRSEHYF